jgi:sulfate permease, SulP family
LVAIASGVFLALARILRLGFLADFLSRTVLVGFLTGVGVQVALGEIHSMLGIDVGSRGFAGQLFFTFRHLNQTYLPNLLISLAVLAIIFAFDRIAPRIPGGLLAVVGMILASALLHWGQHGVRTVGTVPGGLPHLGLPRFAMHDVSSITPIAFSCFLVILAQSAATSRAYAMKYDENFSEERDLVGLSLANVVAGCSGTFVVNGSPTKTAIADSAGGRSQWANLTAAMTVLLVLLFMTKPLSYLPEAVLAAIVFVIGLELIDIRGLADIRLWSPREFQLALVTAATVVFFGVERGLLLAVMLSLLLHVRQNYRPPCGVLMHGPKGEWEIDDSQPGKFVEPGMVMFWFGAGLFYANAAYFARLTRKLADQTDRPVRWFVIDARAITELDYSGGRAVADLQQHLAQQGTVMALIMAETRPKRALERIGFLDVIGTCRMFDSREACIEAYRAEGQATN